MVSNAPDYHKEQLKKSSLLPQKVNRRTWILNSIKFLLPPLLAGGYARFESGWFDLTKTKIRLPNLASNQSVKILHLSDLHLSQATSIEHIELALREGFKSQPHACMITGDFVTDRPDEAKLNSLSRCLEKYAKRIPIFASLGNHDGGEWAGTRDGFPNPTKIKKVLKAAKIRLLHNERVSVYLNGIPLSITGLGDLWSKDCIPQKCMPRIDPKLGPSSNCNILLSHNPDSKTIVNDFDWSLMLSGHTHGGQFRIPFSNFAPLAPVSDLSHTEGLAEFQGRPIFITRGVGSLYGARINCRPELSLLELSRT